MHQSHTDFIASNYSGQAIVCLLVQLTDHALEALHGDHAGVEAPGAVAGD